MFTQEQVTMIEYFYLYRPSMWQISEQFYVIVFDIFMLCMCILKSQCNMSKNSLYQEFIYMANLLCIYVRNFYDVFMWNIIPCIA